MMLGQNEAKKDARKAPPNTNVNAMELIAMELMVTFPA